MRAAGLPPTRPHGAVKYILLLPLLGSKVDNRLSQVLAGWSHGSLSSVGGSSLQRRKTESGSSHRAGPRPRSKLETD